MDDSISEMFSLANFFFHFSIISFSELPRAMFLELASLLKFNITLVFSSRLQQNILRKNINLQFQHNAIEEKKSIATSNSCQTRTVKVPVKVRSSE